MSKDKKKSWFRRHWFLTGILGFFLLLVIVSMFQGIIDSATGNAIKDSRSLTNELIVTSANLLLPQDSEIDRIWRINDIESITENTTGFIEGSKRSMSKAETLGGSSIITRAYRFDSINNANQFYDQEKQKIDIRGVKEWNLGSGCFGIDRESLLSGSAEGLCLRNNVVFYIRSASTSFYYVSYGKDFMKIMLKKI